MNLTLSGSLYSSDNWNEFSLTRSYFMMKALTLDRKPVYVDFWIKFLSPSPMSTFPSSVFYRCIEMIQSSSPCQIPVSSSFEGTQVEKLWLSNTPGCWRRDAGSKVGVWGCWRENLLLSLPGVALCFTWSTEKQLKGERGFVCSLPPTLLRTGLRS